MDAFTKFTIERRSDLARIARHTRGEHGVDDVVNEAWLLAASFCEQNTAAADFSDATFQQRLLAHLYQRLVRYTEQHIRRAIRLDHPSREENAVTLIDRIADASGDPLSEAIFCQEISSPPETTFSLAAAYVILLQRFDNRMRALANHLLISASHAYRCCAKARWLVAHQHSLAWRPTDTETALKPWRSFRARRIPKQLEFQFSPPSLLAAHVTSPSRA